MGEVVRAEFSSLSILENPMPILFRSWISNLIIRRRPMQFKIQLMTEEGGAETVQEITVLDKDFLTASSSSD